MTITVSDIIAGPVRVFNAPVGEAKPDETTVDVGDAWGGNWVEMGATQTPLVAAYEFETEDWEIEQSLAAVDRRKTGHKLSLETVLSEFSADNLQLAFGGAVTKVAAGASQRGYEDLDVGDVEALEKLQWGFEGIYTNAAGDQFPVRLFLHKGTAVVGGQLQFAKADGYTGIPLRIEALSDFDQASEGERLFKLQRVTAEATS